MTNYAIKLWLQFQYKEDPNDDDSADDYKDEKY